MKMTVEDKLGVNKFNVDEENCHIKVNRSYPDADEIDRIVRICPAALYKKDGEGVRIDYIGCLECGACRILSAGKIVEGWEYPIGVFGVSYRQG